MNLQTFNLEDTVLEMLYEFGRINDSHALMNIKTHEGLVQVKLTMCSDDDGDFNDYSEIPLLVEKNGTLKEI